MSAIYVETSIVGYLTARSASDVVFQARQELTRRWWQQRRDGFDLYISQLVLDEPGRVIRRQRRIAYVYSKACRSLGNLRRLIGLPTCCSRGTSCRQKPRRMLSTSP